MFPAASGHSTTRRAVFLVLCTAALIYLFLWISPFDRSRVHRPLQFAKTPSFVEDLFAQPDPERKDYHEWNARSLRELHTCIAMENCGPNQKKVALLAAHWFQEAIVTGFRGGEGIW